jgi:hypothetical protein
MKKLTGGSECKVNDIGFPFPVNLGNPDEINVLELHAIVELYVIPKLPINICL